jgi:hypothetical protein
MKNSPAAMKIENFKRSGTLVPSSNCLPNEQAVTRPQAWSSKPLLRSNAEGGFFLATRVYTVPGGALSFATKCARARDIYIQRQSFETSTRPRAR